jgi:hypothetical protein
MVLRKNNSVAPVCPVSRDQAVSAMPAARIPAIPRALDLPSLVRAINTINLIMQNMAPLLAPSANGLPLPMPIGSNAASPQQQSGGSIPYESKWTENRRESTFHDIYHKKANGKYDRSQRVKVYCIHEITFYNHEFKGKGDDLFKWKYKHTEDKNSIEQIQPYKGSS